MSFSNLLKTSRKLTSQLSFHFYEKQYFIIANTEVIIVVVVIVVAPLWGAGEGEASVLRVSPEAIQI